MCVRLTQLTTCPSIVLGLLYAVVGEHYLDECSRSLLSFMLYRSVNIRLFTSVESVPTSVLKTECHSHPELDYMWNTHVLLDVAHLVSAMCV